MNEKCVLKINDLSFGYQKENLMYKNFNLEVNRGEIISIVGTSGSGKSTLFELISKNLNPLKGSIETKKIASIYQDPYSSFHPTFSIKEQIDDVLGSYDMKEFLYFLEKLNLTNELLSFRPHKLSGGQLQRCSILRALLMKPDLLLADEPTSALDNIIALDTMKILVGFADTFGILLITHDSDLASWCSDRIINIEK
ncbi:ATP-binding cassette domain-containing protein [Arcobacteraceae bacterium]|nr:ATP-binding cassette domain-containing protein [Arcobacteraceae bacterium]